MANPKKNEEIKKFVDWFLKVLKNMRNWLKNWIQICQMYENLNKLKIDSLLWIGQIILWLEHKIGLIKFLIR